MLSNDNSTISYNNFLEVPYISYKIIEALLKVKTKEAEDLWKLLKYVDQDCLNKPNLTLEEKKKLIWSGDSIEQNYGIFMKPLIGSSLGTAEEQTQIRIYRSSIYPNSEYNSTITIECDFITNEKSSLVKLDGMLVEKTDLMESLFLNIFTGRDIKVGSGFLSFDRNVTRSCNSQLVISNSKTFYGRSLMLGLNYSIIDSGGEC